MISLMTNKLKTSRELRVELPKELYLSGEELTGRVHFTPKKTMSVALVKIHFVGEEFCAWSERIAMRTGAPPTSGDVKLFRKEQALVSDKARFSTGTYTWNFRFVVPRDIPPSIIYKRGQACVAYFLKVKASTGFGRFDMVCVAPVILGQLWVPIRPIAIHNTDHSGSGNIRLQVIASHSVAHCEEDVGVHVEIDNNSPRQVEAVRLKLKQVWECSGIFHHKNTVCKVECQTGFPVGRGRHERDARLIIPAYLIVVPTVSNATLFKCSYYIGVSLVVRLGGMVEKERVKCHIPIIISNMPAEPNAPPQNTLPLAGAVPTNPNPRSSSRPPPPHPLNRSRSHLEVLESTIDPEVSRMIAELQLSSEIMGENASAGSTGATRTLERADSHASIARESEHEKSSDKPSERSSEMIDLTSGSDAPKNECVVCYDGPKNMLMLPCAHIATCADCTAQIMRTSKKCPVCRCVIRQILRTYQV